MISILKPVLLRERRPIKSKRYILKLFGGRLVQKRWLPAAMEFSRIDNPLVESWYQDVNLPSIEDMHFIVESQIPQGAHPREKELMQKGARLAIEHLYELIRRA